MAFADHKSPNYVKQTNIFSYAFWSKEKENTVEIFQYNDLNCIISKRRCETIIAFHIFFNLNCRIFHIAFTLMAIFE